MPSPAITPDDIKAAPDHSHAIPSPRHSHPQITRSPTTPIAAKPMTTASTPPSPVLSTPAPATPSTTSTGRSTSTPTLSPTPKRQKQQIRNPWLRADKWLHYAAVNKERGMSTAEYAVGTIAACAFAALLFKVVSSPEVQEMLTSLINRALNTTKE
ncbi:hypothetical protein GCM10022224_027190 [Nonomuraea antimicrobica]|uniref:DUF4244 domain-containing protein n=2 Tax=Nonomuraea antimicrobica TaxID=561173 RepID=A0ABP7BKJ0_9ACTN